MRYFVLFLPLLVLTGCSANPAQAAADAAFCVSAESTLTAISDGYNAGLVDSGVLASATELFSSTLGSLVTDELSGSLDQLGELVGQSQPVTESSEQVSKLLEDIRTRCSAVGVEF